MVEAEFARAYAATPRYVVSDSLEAAPNGATLIRRTDARSAVLPRERRQLDLRLVECREFASGTLWLRYGRAS